MRLGRGVYVTTDALAVAEASGRRHALDCLAVLLSVGRLTAAISHTSAARLWGLTVRRGLDTVVRLTDPLQWRRGNGYRMTQAPLPPTDLHTSGPIRATALPRTLVDCAREWQLDDAVVAIDSALLARRLDAGALQAAVTSVRHWPGAPRAERAAELADARAESPLETRGRLRIVGSGLPRAELQVEIRTAGRLVAVVEAWFDDAAVAVEFDGQVKYRIPWRGRTPERVLWEEKRREDELRALDIRVARGVDADLGDRWVRVETRLRQLLATPGPSRREFVAVPRKSGRRRAGSAPDTGPAQTAPGRQQAGYRRVACAGGGYRPTRAGAGAVRGPGDDGPATRRRGGRGINRRLQASGRDVRWGPCRSSSGRSASCS